MTKPILIKDLGRIYPNAKCKQKAKMGIYKCSCGKEFRGFTYSINKEETKSCGCFKRSVATRKKHGQRRTRIYRIWQNMKRRCYTVSNPNYKNYGARGVKLCDEWLYDILVFKRWALSHGYQEHLTIDRINNNGIYEPSNCRWTTKTIQARNTRILMSTNTSGFRGVSFYKKANAWMAYITLNKKKVYLGYFGVARDGALAYDKYIKENNLEHTPNFKPS